MKNLSTKSALLVVLILCAGLAMGQSSKRKSVKTSYLNYPVVPQESVNTYRIAIYPNSIAIDQNDLKLKKGLGSKLQAFQDNANNLDIEFFNYKRFSLHQTNADVDIEIAFGDFNITGKSIASHKIPCKHEGAKLSKENILECPAYYYEIGYTLQTILRIKDKSGQVLYASKLDDDGETHFGYDKSGLSGYLKQVELDKAYANPNVEEGLAKKVLIGGLTLLENRVNEAFCFFQIDAKIDVATASGKAFDYSDLDNAQEQAIDVYEKMRSGQDASSELNKSIYVWETVLQELDKSDTKAKINRRVGLGLYENLAQAYTFMHNNEKALENINSALKLQQLVGNKSREDHFNNLRSTIIYRKNTEAGYLINKDISGEKVISEMILQMARVKAKDNPHQFLYVGDKIEEFQADYIKYAGEENKALSNEATLKGAIEQFKSSGYADRVQSSTAGNILMLMSFTGDKFETLPLEICELGDLNQLNAGGIPGFTTIPPDIKNMKSLRKLMLQNNSITILPPEIGDLANLEVLNLANNQLTSLPDEIKKLKKLKKLTLKGNNIPSSQIGEIQAALPKCKIK